jgi:hypothetical protein
LRELRPASFREYLNIKKGFDFSVLNLDEIISRKDKLILQYLGIRTYLTDYFREGGLLIDYEESLFANVLNKMLTEDLGYLRDINVKIGNSLYKMLYKIAMSEPFEVNFSRLARHLEINKNLCIDLVDQLTKINLVERLNSRKHRSEPKLYLSIPFRKFLCDSIGLTPNMGSLREDFVVMHLAPDHYVKSDYRIRQPDFIKDKRTFEVGGRGKRKRQNADYRIVDGIDAVDNKIPMILLGFLY